MMKLEMWKWTLPNETELATIIEGQPIALSYDPWRESGDPSMKEINKIAFKSWYE